MARNDVMLADVRTGLMYNANIVDEYTVRFLVIEDAHQGSRLSAAANCGIRVAGMDSLAMR